MSHKRRMRKPFLAIVTSSYVPDMEEELKRLVLAEGIPCFPTFQRPRWRHRVASAINAAGPSNEVATANAGDG